MKQIITYIKIFLLLSLVVFLYGFAQNRNKQHKVAEIQVRFLEEQPKFLTKKMVEKLLKKTNTDLLKQQKSTLDLHVLERELQQHDMIESVEVYTSPKKGLQVQLTQRVPIARIVEGGKIFYLDRQGKDMPLSANYSARVPLVTGVSGSIAKQEVFELLIRFQKDDFYNKQIIGIHKKVNGDYLLSTRIGRHKVLLGSIANVEDKLKKLKFFYKKEWDSSTLNTYKLINLKYHRQVVCSK